MKKRILFGLAGMMLVSTAANAISVTGQAGEHYTNLGVGLGTESSGLAVTGNWMHSDNDGDAAGLGLGLNIPLGPFLATVGGKGVYTNPKSGDEGYAAAVGGGLQWKIGDSFRLFGEYYYSPDSLSSGIQSYQEANAGASWTIMRPLSIEAGYRYLNLEGKDGNKDSTIADGPYVGVSASF
jgi:opacity protein-like surface antigen